jgi:DNA-binding response OmpR family regulator
MQQILIIDDETEVCFLLKHFFIQKNKQVAVSTNLKEGIEQLKKLKPDLLILDHNLPDGFGIENIPQIRSIHPSLLIVVISAMSDLKNDALKKGADYFIEKPISFNALNKVLAEN